MLCRSSSGSDMANPCGVRERRRATTSTSHLAGCENFEPLRSMQNFIVKSVPAKQQMSCGMEWGASVCVGLVEPSL